MKTIILEEPFKLSLTDTEAPQTIKADEALVKVHKVGICGTDLHAFAGLQNFFSYPRILGHELAVEVLEVGADATKHNISVGDYAAVDPYYYDGTCSACKRGKTNCCRNMRVIGVHEDGGMREQFVVPLSKLYKAELNLNQLAQVEMLAVGAHAVARANLQPTETTVVIGAGPIGLGVASFARLHSKRLIMIDISPERLAFVKKLNIAETIDGLGGKEDVVEQLKSLLDGELPTTVFDATGNAQSMMNTVDYVDHGSQLIFVGHTKNELTFFNPAIHSKELSIICSRNATANDFQTVIQTLQSGAIDVEQWITHRASPEQLVLDFESWTKAETGVVKGLLEFS